MRHIPILLFLAFSCTLIGQIPSEIILNPADESTFSRACPDRNAGSISLGTFSGQSSDITLTRSFLCLNDRLNFIHNGDDDVLDSDPNVNTTPGIGYAWYTCPPTIDRPSLDDVFNDPCLLTDPPPNMGIYVYVDDINGDALFQNGNQINGQSIPDFFNNGDPIELWFAPITIDAVSAGQAVFEGNPSGPCVHVNINAAFSIVYLTPISSNNRKVISDGAGGCLGSFELKGGLPQFDDNSFYSITIEHVDMPGTFATLQGSDYGHQDEVVFSFVEEGTYRVTVEDEKSCVQEFEMDVLCTNPVSFNLSGVTANVGDVVCVELTLEGFIDMGTTSFDIAWNPNIFEYVSNSGFQIAADPFSQIVDSRVDEGRLRVLWLASNLLTGQTEPDGTTFFEICLRAIGECGEQTSISFDGNIIVTDFNNNDLTHLVNDGLASINAGVFSALADVCPDDGSNTGSIKLSMCGGVAPYSVNYSGPNGGGTGSITDQNGMQIISNLPAGDYDFTIVDDNGTNIMQSFTVPSGDIHNVLAGVTNPTCSYSSDGSIGLNIVPSGDYEIFWSTSEFNTDTIRNVNNGQYGVTVTDMAGCAVTTSVTVNTEPIAILGSVMDATCLSSANGRIDASAQGGTIFSDATYLFQWQGFPATRGSSSALPNIMRGDYLLTVSDSNGCFNTRTFTVNADKEIILDNVNLLEPDCNGDMTGSLEVQVSTLNASNDDGYIYDWRQNGMNINASFITGSDVSTSNVGLGAGRYDVTITDFDEGLDCILDTFFVINEPPPIIVDVTFLEEETCNPGTDGELTVRASGGRANSPVDYIYDWGDHPSITDFSPSQQGLSAGIFTLTVYDLGDLRCFVDTFFEITQQAGPEILSFDSVSLSCGAGMDGELEVFYIRPQGQTFDVNWTDENGMNYSGDRIVGLNSGTYTVTVTASAGCESIDTVTLGIATDITLDSVQYGIPTCPNSQNGSVTVFATGPGGTLHYMWNHINGSDNQVLPSVGVGIYSVTITADGANCPPFVIDTLEVRAPEIFDVSFSAVTGATCPGICNGSATAVATGGVGMINYQWNGGEMTPTAMALCAGLNSVTISDNLCFEVHEIDIPAADSISLSVDQAGPTCFGDTDGFIRLSPSGSNPPFSVRWNDGPMTPNRNGIPAGIYVSTIQDAMGCERIDTFRLTEPSELTAFFAPGDLLQITCAGRDDGRATVSVSGGTGDYTYTWDPDLNQNNSIQNLSPGSYAMTVEDERGCTTNIDFNISEPPAIQFELGDQSTIQCFGETAEFTVDTAYSGAGGPYMYTVNNGLQQDLGEIVNLFGGQYVITVIDSSGCFIETSVVITQPLEFSVDLGPDVTVSLGDSARLQILTTSGTFPIDSFNWSSTGNDLSCNTCQSPWITPVQEVLVNLLVVDSTGCYAQDELTVFVDTRRKVYIPNAFSPNNDGINEMFEVFTGIGVLRISSMQIFNRWGGRVFEARNLPASGAGSGGWDGTHDGEVLTPDIYAYVIQVEFVDNKIVTYKGEVQVLK